MVVAAGYVLLLGDLRTGQINARLPFSAGLKWGQRLNGPGPMSATLRPFSEELRKYNLRSLTTTMKMFMAISYGDTILEAGPILSRPYDEDTRDLVLNGLGLWSIFDRRKNLPGAYLVPGAKVTEARVTVTPRHPGSIVRELLRMSLEDNPYGAGGLPVVLPATVAGTESRVYHGYDLSWLGDDFRDLSKLVDLRLRPRFVPGDATRIEWVYEHGTVDVLTQAGPDWRWDGTVERSGLTGIGVNQDGTGVGSLAWAVGSGQEQAMKLASARNLDLVAAGFPWTEVEESGGSQEDQSVLQGVADRAALDAARPWDSWTMTVRADVEPALGSYLPGDWALVLTPEGHPVLPAGVTARVRVLAVDGDESLDVKLTVAPIQGLESDRPGQVYTAALLPSPDLLPSPTLLPAVY